MSCYTLLLYKVCVLLIFKFMSLVRETFESILIFLYITLDIKNDSKPLKFHNSVLYNNGKIIPCFYSAQARETTHGNYNNEESILSVACIMKISPMVAEHWAAPTLVQVLISKERTIKIIYHGMIQTKHRTYKLNQEIKLLKMDLKHFTIDGATARLRELVHHIRKKFKATLLIKN